MKNKTPIQKKETIAQIKNKKVKQLVNLLKFDKQGKYLGRV